jgi:hypothetical protein
MTTNLDKVSAHPADIGGKQKHQMGEIRYGGWLLQLERALFAAGAKPGTALPEATHRHSRGGPGSGSSESEKHLSEKRVADQEVSIPEAQVQCDSTYSNAVMARYEAADQSAAKGLPDSPCNELLRSRPAGSAVSQALSRIVPHTDGASPVTARQLAQSTVSAPTQVDVDTQVAGHTIPLLRADKDVRLGMQSIHRISDAFLKKADAVAHLNESQYSQPDAHAVAAGGLMNDQTLEHRQLRGGEDGAVTGRICKGPAELEKLVEPQQIAPHADWTRSFASQLKQSGAGEQIADRPVSLFRAGSNARPGMQTMFRTSDGVQEKADAIADLEEPRHGQSDTHAAQARGRTSHETYAPRQLHLYRGEDGVQAWIRDAELNGPGARQVIQAVGDELRNMGAQLTALTLNGKKIGAGFGGSKNNELEDIYAMTVGDDGTCEPEASAQSAQVKRQGTTAKRGF